MQLSVVEETLVQARSFGFRQLPNGTQLLGHVPHVAPEAWFHQRFSPLSEEDIVHIEEQLAIALPPQFRAFLMWANGLGLFSGSLSIYGKRHSYARTGDDVWQPFCIVTANTLDRPPNAIASHVVVGSYRADGSLVWIDSKSGIALRTKPRSMKPLNQWASFCDMLTSEVKRLGKQFERNGRRRANAQLTPPPN